MAVAIRIFRLIMPVADIEAAARFYGSLLDQTGIRVSHGRHYLECGGVILALYDPRADGDSGVARPNFDHVYFAVSDLDAVHDRAKAVGGLSEDVGDGNLPMGQITRRPWGERSFYMRDPFGNKLCFVDETTVFTAGPRPTTAE
jgi:catechol 2,3-dioxygenase-like lactoylglutathione lyase family enzyme